MSSNPVVLISLNNGMVIAGKLLKEAEESITIEDPLTLTQRQISGLVATGYGLMSLVRYLPFAKETVHKFYKHDVMNCVPASESFSHFYQLTLDQSIKLLDGMIEEEIARVVKDFESRRDVAVPAAAEAVTEKPKVDDAEEAKKKEEAYKKFLQSIDLSNSRPN